MKYIRLIAAGLALTAAVAHAQGDAKKDLVQKLLQLQQPGVEMLARQLAEQPASQAAQEAALAIRARVAADKRDAAIKASDAEIKKYLDEVIPLVQQKAVEVARTAVGPILEEKFTEDELKQLVAMIDSPVYKKYVQIDPELRNALLRKLVTDTKPQVDPKIRTLQANINKIIGVPAQPAAQPAQPAAPAKK